MNDVYKNFITKSYLCLQDYEKKGRYFHNLTPKDNSPLVVHKKTNQLTYVIDGTGIVTLNEKQQHINKNSVVFIEQGTTHKFVATSSNLVLFHIHIPDEGREKDRYVLEGSDYNRYEES